MKKAKLISILTTTLMVILALATVVVATDIGGVSVTVDTSSASSVGTIGGKIIGIIRVVGTFVAVGMVLILGIKYMAGSAEEKAANKKSMVPYLIGAVLLFIGVQIVQAVYNWASTIQL